MSNSSQVKKLVTLHEISKLPVLVCVLTCCVFVFQMLSEERAKEVRPYGYSLLL